MDCISMAGLGLETQNFFPVPWCTSSSCSCVILVLKSSLKLILNYFRLTEPKSMFHLINLLKLKMWIMHLMIPVSLAKFPCCRYPKRGIPGTSAAPSKARLSVLWLKFWHHSVKWYFKFSSILRICTVCHTHFFTVQTLKVCTERGCAVINHSFPMHFECVKFVFNCWKILFIYCKKIIYRSILIFDSSD